MKSDDFLDSKLKFQKFLFGPNEKNDENLNSLRTYTPKETENWTLSELTCRKYMYLRNTCIYAL